MKRFIQGEHRGQSTLLPESLDDYVSDINPVRIVDVSSMNSTWSIWVLTVLFPLTQAGLLPPRNPAEDLYLRLSQPHPVEPTAGARGPTQRRADVANRAFDA